MAVEATQEQLEAGRGYETLFVPALFAPWTKHLVNGVSVDDGDHVLDIACGSGALARDALARAGQKGRVVGLDPAPGMIAAAREVESKIEWVLGTAEELPFDNDSFECVVSQFGVMFFQDRQKAANEMFRVIKPGGRLAIAAWHSIDQNPAYGDIVSVLDEHVSSAAGDAVRLPFCLGNPDQVAELLSLSGFEDIDFETKTERANFPSTRTIVEVELRGWLPLFDIHLSEEKVSEVLIEAEPKLRKYATPNGTAVFPTTAYIMTARKSD